MAARRSPCPRTTSRRRASRSAAPGCSTPPKPSAASAAGSLGESDWQEQVQYQFALEQQLADTIDQVQGVSSAQVELALPIRRRRCFSSSTQQPTAAVLLSDGSAPQLGRSSRHRPTRGQSPAWTSTVNRLRHRRAAVADGSAGGGGGGLALEDAESTSAQQEEAQVGRMLTATLRTGYMTTVVVDAQLNDDRADDRRSHLWQTPLRRIRARRRDARTTRAATSATSTTVPERPDRHRQLELQEHDEQRDRRRAEDSDAVADRGPQRRRQRSSVCARVDQGAQKRELPAITRGRRGGNQRNTGGDQQGHRQPRRRPR